jgi:hypothetical protein
VFGDRLQKRVSTDLQATVCCGITEAQPCDDSKVLFARADSALYSAKAAGLNRLFVHTGTHIREHLSGTVLGAAKPIPTRAPATSSGNDRTESGDEADCPVDAEELTV